MRGAFLLGLGLVVAWLTATESRAQEPAGQGPVIDTIIVRTENIFGQQEARSNAIFRIANGLRFKTRPYVVRQELLFDVGDPFDLERLAETARNLRQLGLFRFVGIDTTRVGDRFAVVVVTQDGWSTQLQLNGAFTAGTFTWSTGLTEINFLGTGNLVSATYQNGTDENTATLVGRAPRFLGTTLFASGAYQALSADGRRGFWQVGRPFRAFADRRAWEVVGEAARHRIYQYRVRSAADVDTTRYWRRALRNGIVAAVAPIADTREYLRIGVSAEVRREEYLRFQDRDRTVEDTLTAMVGAFAEYRRANFHVVTHFNGFGLQEDLDLSTVVRVAARLAPSAFGYARTGVGPGVFVGGGFRYPAGYGRLSLNANALLTGAGIDSGRVEVRGTLALQPIPRHATFLHLRAGAQDAPAPGSEFDLGHGIGPRSFGPHAFTGTRSAWGTLEHRWFAFDDLGGLVGLGLATFLDYGGAWYPGQSPRVGGNVGFGIRTGFNRATGANTGRIDFGYRFGEGWSGRRWAVSFGRGLVF